MMKGKWMRRLGLASLALGTAWLSGACAQERDPINRVQANALSKHFFAGDNLSDPADDPEFHMRNTVVDVPFGAAQSGLFTATYAQPLTRIKWEISEQSLIARETYEHVQDSDFHGSKRTNDGQVVAMFAIESHFDIRRDYNPQTGEENNLVIENTTDRPWYAREYMRVDWSKNLVTDGYEVDTLSQIGVFGGVKWAPMAYYIADPNSPDAPVFSEQDGYFDVTTKAFATPQDVDVPPFGVFPACFLSADYGGSAPIANCNPTEVTLRLSFRRVVDTDYEASDQTGPKQEAFGWFTIDRYGYERNYGVLDEKWHRFAAKYNIWKQSHVAGSQCAVDYWRDANGNIAKYRVDSGGSYYTDAKSGLPIPDASGQPFAGTPIGADVHRDTNHDGTEDDCAFTDAASNPLNQGSRCDEFAQKCDLPLYQRDLRTIPWYYGPASAPDLFASTAKALGQWNVAVKRAAMIGKSVEARRVGFDPASFVTGTDAAGNPIDLTTEAGLIADAGKTVPDVFVLCHNPVVTGDAAACGPVGLAARLGDIRYNIVNLIPTPQSPSPWGIMVDGDDPLTGEKIVTSVNVWDAVTDIAAQGTEDILRWMNGEISDQQIASGAYLRDWAKASQLGTARYTPPALSTAEIKSRVASVDRGLASNVALTADQKALPHDLRLQAAATQLAQKLGPSLDGQLEGVRQSLIGTKWEAQMVTPEWLQAAGLDPSTPIAGDNTSMAKASPLRGMNPMMSDWVRRQRDVTMAKSASCMVEEPEPDSLVGLARQAGKLYPLPDKADRDYPAKLQSRQKALHSWIREQFHLSVIAHEMGHSMGLRHNFTGNYDPLNFHTEYWQLRTRNGQEHFCVTPVNGAQPPWSASSSQQPVDATTTHTDGSECVGPRWVDPVTDTETNGLIWKWGSTTVMDYPGDQSQDTNDIGPYDKAAMRYGYADVVDVDTDATLAKVGTTYAADPGQTDKGSAYLFALDGFGGIGGSSVGAVHYSTYGDKFNVLGTCTKATDPNDPLTAKCSGPPLDYVALRDMQSVGKYGDAAVSHLPQTLANFAVDARGRVRHPYMFGSDEFADIGNVPVFRFDSGADSYEQFEFLISTYENRYIFDNFRRDRPTFSTMGSISRAMGRYFSKIQGMTKSLALLTELEGNSSASVGATNPLSDPGNLLPLVLGASDGLKMFARIITRPEPGPFTLSAPPLSPAPSLMPFAAAENNNFITLPPGNFNVSLGAGEGRYLHNDYDYSQGYYWADYQTQVGSAYEKSLAVWYLTEAYNHFISNAKQDYVDGRYKNLNYASIYPNQVRRLFSQLLQNDPFTYGPYVTLDTGLAKDGTAHVQYLPWEKWDVDQSATIDLDYPKGATVIDPLVGWEQQYRMLIDLFMMGPTTLTMDLVDQLRIFSPGGADSISIDPAQQVRYRDPATGIEYVARGYGTELVNSRGAKVARSMGARMIQYANQMAAATYAVKATDPVTGELTYETDANGQPLCQDPNGCITNATTLKNFSSNLDVVRQLTLFFGYGPLGHGEN